MAVVVHRKIWYLTGSELIWPARKDSPQVFRVQYESSGTNKPWMILQPRVSMDQSRAFSGLQHDFIQAKFCANSFTMNALQLIYSYFLKRSQLVQG